MPVEFEIDLEGANPTQRALKNMSGDAQELTELHSSKIAKFFAQEIRKRVFNVLDWTGRMAGQGVKVRQARDQGRFASGFVVTVSREMENGRGDVAEWNENANTGHFVEIAPRNYPINEWAEEVGLSESLQYVYVTPQPFMTKAIRRGLMSMRRYVDAGGDLETFVNQRF